MAGGGRAAAGVVGVARLLRLRDRGRRAHVPGVPRADIQAVDVHVPRAGQLVPVRVRGGGRLWRAVRAGRVRRRARHARLHGLVRQHRGAVPQL